MSLSALFIQDKQYLYVKFVGLGFLYFNYAGIAMLRSIYVGASFFAVIFIFISFVQSGSNALPFILHDYPTYEINGRENFDLNSENLILSRIDFELLSVNYPSNFQLWRINGDPRALGYSKVRDVKSIVNPTRQSDYLLNGAPYVSQVGIQSLLWARLSEKMEIKIGNYTALRIIHMAILSTIFANIAMWVRLKFSSQQAMWSVAAICTSTGVAIFSGSLYWSIALFFAPMSISVLHARFRRFPFFLFYVIMFSAFFIKFCAGYEFISTIVILACLPALADISSFGIKDCIYRCAGVLFVALIAFGASLHLFNVLFFEEFHRSGWEYIFSRSSSWTALDAFGGSIGVWAAQIAKVLSMSVVSIDKFGVPIFVFIIIYFMSIFRFWRFLPKDEQMFLIGALAASVSWCVLQSGHILFHPRYATLVAFPIIFSFAICLLPRLICRRRVDL